MKKVLIIIVSLVLVGALGLGIYYIVTNDSSSGNNDTNEKLDKDSKYDSKNVRLEIQTEGILKTGYAIANIETSDDYVTLYGDKQDLDNIDYLPVVINVDDFGSEEVKTFEVELRVPDNVIKMNKSVIEVKLYFEKAIQKEFTISVEVTNLGERLYVNTRDSSGTQVDVVVTGTEEVLEGITERNVRAYIDLEGLSAGEHEVPVYVETVDSRIIGICREKVNVIIYEVER